MILAASRGWRGRYARADDVPPTSHAVPMTNVFRQDAVRALPAARRGARRSAGRRGRPLPRPAHPRGGGMSDRADRRAHRRRARRRRRGRRGVSAVEVAQAHLDRIAATDGEVHAFLHVDAEGALAAAARGRRRARPGRAARPAGRRAAGAQGRRSSPAACPTTCGSKILEGWLPPYDATVVSRLRDAGVVVLGKTNMDEFAMGSSTENSAYGPTRNPWDLGRIPGGSSRRFARPRSPRAGAAGHRHRHRRLDPPARRVSPASSASSRPTARCRRYGLVAFSSSLDQGGPFARTVLDAALLHEVIAGHDPLRLDLASTRPSRRSSRPRAGRERSAGVRVGVVARARRRGLPARRRAALPARRSRCCEELGAESSRSAARPSTTPCPRTT